MFLKKQVMKFNPDLSLFFGDPNVLEKRRKERKKPGMYICMCNYAP